ncbi:glycosyltransferase family 4 protein [Amylibacter sp.]|nr:glycosyltransferase family 4 protein [Amylibacter sp.]
MNITFLTANFPPESNAPAIRTYEHIKLWSASGCNVKVITGAPNFPEGKLYNGYKNKWLDVDRLHGVVLWRVKTFITANRGSSKRILSFLSYMLSSFIFGIFSGKADIVIGTSPQFFTAVSAWALAGIKRAKFVFEVRDIWPASIVAVGAIRPGIVLSCLEKLEIFLYRRADLIVVVTEMFKSELVKRGVDHSKIIIITNGSNLSVFQPRPKPEKFLNDFNLNGKFVVGYVGTHGMAHALDKVIEAANLIKKHRNIHFLFVGGGAMKVEFDKKIAELELVNVTSLPRQERSFMTDFLSMCDISMVSLRDVELFKTVIPSKIFESMAMGIPILCSIPKGQATKIIKENDVGWNVPPESPAQLANKILKLSRSDDERQIVSKNCLLAAKKYDRDELGSRYLKELRRLI